MQDSGPAERDRLLARYGRHFRKGEVIFREGDEATEGYLLQEGRVRLLKKVGSVERSLMVLKPNELFGETALLDGARRNSTAVALADSSALALDQTTLRRMLETSPSVALRLVNQLVRRLRDAEDQIEIMMLRDAQAKIVHALIRLAETSSASPGRSRLLEISPMDLSSRVGLDVNTVKRGIQQLRDGNYIRIVDEHLEVTDLEALGQLHSLLSLKQEIRGTESSLPPARPSGPPNTKSP
jgi:CRP-like cAMP-binding protein